MSAENLNNFCAITYLERTPVSFGPGVFFYLNQLFSKRKQLIVNIIHAKTARCYQHRTAFT